MLTQAVSIANDVAGSTPLTGLLVPLIVAAVAKNSLDPRLKALIAGLLSLGAAVFAADGQIDQDVLEAALANTFSAIAAYKGIWEHVGVNDWLAPSKGIGPKPSTPEPGDPDFISNEGFEGS